MTIHFLYWVFTGVLVGCIAITAAIGIVHSVQLIRTSGIKVALPMAGRTALKIASVILLFSKMLSLCTVAYGLLTVLCIYRFRFNYLYQTSSQNVIVILLFSLVVISFCLNVAISVG